MISFDLECPLGHRFEGIFKDYQSFDDQLKNEIIECPFCESREIKRLFTGCSIQKRASSANISSDKNPNIFEVVKAIEKYVKENFDNVGKDFYEASRAIYYGVEEERNIYGESTKEEIDELREEGINVFPLPDIEKLEN
jgi:hypothetical protein